MRQAQAMTVMMSADSVFLTGAPGSGKSYVLSKFVRAAQAQGHKVAVTASTGIAATHIGGTTIHSWSGIGIRETIDSRDLAALSRQTQLVARFRSSDILVIDEISMLPGWFLDLLDSLAKALRDDQRPFGGLKIVLVGDMFQLPPVSRGSSTEAFAHHSAAWSELDPLVCYLDEQHRQSNDGLLAVLEAMRNGGLDTKHIELLESRMQIRPPEDVEVTRLYSHNVNVDAINQKRIAMLDGPPMEFEMGSKGPSAAVDQLSRRVLAPRLLQLKVGAEIMFVANDPARAFVNGSRGKVVRFHDGRPVVELANSGRHITVGPYAWQNIEDDKVRAEVVQLPLRLAWAITIHKSQGMSIDSAEIDLSRSFTPGMGYVALSRLRSLQGLYLSGMNAMALRLHPEIFELDEKLRHSSDDLAKSTSDHIEPEAAIDQSGPSTKTLQSGRDLLGALKAWRHRRAASDGIPDFMIVHNSQLEEIALRIPVDETELLAIKGIGMAKLASFGDDILALTRAYTV
ncbi:MAG: hypothetical protein EPN30_03345 [Actinomycetota bacterium]|nr:MAG: hypothetical protein EPN30_03345 [Actinomycetota bacterium]